MTDTRRHHDLRQILMARRRALEDELQARLRVGRTRPVHDGGDLLEESDARTQADIDLMLLQMRADTLVRIGEALARLDAGDYGICRGCGGEIAGQRLRALPFAVRCRTCEEQIERESARVERPTPGSQRDPLFPGLAPV